MKILVVDDEPSLLNIIKIYLSRQGYEVTACHSANSASERFTAAPSTYSLVIVDMTLSGMSAEKFIEEVLQGNPNIRAIAMSGHPGALDNLRERRHPRIAFLEKPFTPAMLTDTLSEVLRRGSSAAG